MSDIKNEVKMAIREFLEELTGPKVTAGATGFGPLPSGDRVFIVGGTGQPSAWYRLDPLVKDKRHYILEEAFTGTVVSVNTRDAAGDERNSRKLDLTMRDSSGHVVTFVFGLRSDLDSAETTIGSKSLVAALASCSDNERTITIAPAMGDKRKSAIFLNVLVDGVPVKSGEVSEHESAENLVLAMAKFGGNHIPLKGQEPTQAQVQPQRSAPVAAPVKAAATVEPVKAARTQQWTDLKFFLGGGDDTVARAKELIVNWCLDRYGLKSPVSIPEEDQEAALYECKEHLIKYANPVATTVPDEGWSDEVPF